MGGDAIAVVGLAGRFPGAPDVASFWRGLLAGVDAVHDYSADELRTLGIGDGFVPACGRLDGVADFDAAFFGISPDEAIAMDPQHRLFLEQAWIALDDCGPSDGLVGVFAGSALNRYFLLHQFDPNADLVPGWSADYLPAQVAYRLDLTGPAVAVQTACSSSLVAVCTAATALADYRCDLALAGGVSVMEPRFRHTPGGLVSPDGRCRAFDAAGEGAAYGSGVAVLALKRLEDAEEAGDQVYAVLRGWAVGNDGATRAGFSAPGLRGQAQVVAEALASAELDGAGIGYVEAHGSGTLAGDAIEVAALAQAFGPGLAPASCALGSVKTNVGNLDAAAGAVGLIKAVLAVRHGVVPQNLHFDEPSPEIDFGPFFVPVKNHPLEVRRAGVSSFGLGGTNAHVIVESAPQREPREPCAPGWQALQVSARTPKALEESKARLADHLESEPGLRLDDVAFTLAGRRAFTHRFVAWCRDVEEAVGVLRGGESLAQEPEPRAAGRRVSLPGYPFQRQRYWIEDRP